MGGLIRSNTQYRADQACWLCVYGRTAMNSIVSLDRTLSVLRSRIWPSDLPTTSKIEAQLRDDEKTILLRGRCLTLGQDVGKTSVARLALSCENNSNKPPSSHVQHQCRPVLTFNFSFRWKTGHQTWDELPPLTLHRVETNSYIYRM